MGHHGLGEFHLHLSSPFPKSYGQGQDIGFRLPFHVPHSDQGEVSHRLTVREDNHLGYAGVFDIPGLAAEPATSGEIGAEQVPQILPVIAAEKFLLRAG